MRCPYCSHEETKVVDKRDAETSLTRRRRECLKCEKRFTTYERIESDLRVIKKDGRREQFEREKIKRGILKACEKRPVSQEQIEGMLDKIEAGLREKGSEVPSMIIGQQVMKALRKVDEVAYIRFASVHKEFDSAKKFKEEIKLLAR